MNIVEFGMVLVSLSTFIGVVIVMHKYKNEQVKRQCSVKKI